MAKYSACAAAQYMDSQWKCIARYMDIMNRGLCHEKNTNKQDFVALLKSEWGV